MALLKRVLIWKIFGFTRHFKANPTIDLLPPWGGVFLKSSLVWLVQSVLSFEAQAQAKDDYARRLGGSLDWLVVPLGQIRKFLLGTPNWAIFF